MTFGETRNEKYRCILEIHRTLDGHILQLNNALIQTNNTYRQIVEQSRRQISGQVKDYIYWRLR